MTIHTAYLDDILSVTKFQGHMDHAVLTLRPLGFDAIAVRGNSGTVFGGALSLALHRPLMIVRKITDNRHTGRRVEGDDCAAAYVIVDDHISTGATAASMLREISHAFPHMKCVGMYCYNWEKYQTIETIAADYEIVKHALDELILPR